MKTVDQMTVKEIIESIEVMRNGLSLNPGEREKQILTKNIERAQLELQKRFEEKKTESQASANQGQLPDMEQRREQENKAVWYEERRGKVKANEAEKIRELSGNYQGETRVIGTIEDPTPAPIPVVAISFKTKEGKTEIRRLTQTDILTLLKTYFKRVATSAKMESKRYSEAYDSDMGKTVYKLFQGWNMIYNETQEGAAWPPLADVFPGLGRASQQQKVNAEILWRWASNDK